MEVVDIRNLKQRKIIILKGSKIYFGVMFKFLKENEIYVLDAGKEIKEIIHTFFCFNKIDIFLLNEKLEIVEFYKEVPPFRIIIPKNKFRYIIEGLNLDEKTIREEVRSSLIRS